MGRVEDGQPVDDLRVVHRKRPGNGSAPVVADHQRGLRAALLDETVNVGGELVGAVSRYAGRLRGQVVAAGVRRDDPKARRGERRDLSPPAVPELGEAVQQDDQRPVTSLDVMQPHVAHLGVALLELSRVVEHHAVGRVQNSRRRAHKCLLLSSDSYGHRGGWLSAPTCRARRRPWSAPWSRMRTRTKPVRGPYPPYPG